MNDPTSALVPGPVRRNSGFTLVEMMIVVAIIGILAAVAYPSYRGFVMRSNRSDAQTVLLRMAQNLERRFTVTNSYVGATIGAGDAATDAWGSATSPEGFYGLSFAAGPTATTYTLQATAIGSQAQDTGCSTMTLTEAGVKMPVACWR